MPTPSPQPPSRLPFTLRRIVHQLSAAQAATNARRALEHDHVMQVRVDDLARRLHGRQPAPDSA